jgi:hypothetical protein
MDAATLTREDHERIGDFLADLHLPANLDALIASTPNGAASKHYLPVITREPGCAWEVHHQLRVPRGAADTGYGILAGAAVALSAATAKSVLGVKSHANFALSLTYFHVGYDGVTASAVPALNELCYATFATNAPGTNSTSVTPPQHYGRALTVGATAARNWTAEPTVLTALREFLLTPDSGTVLYDLPLGKEPDCALGEGFATRCNAPATVNVRAELDVRRS